MVDVDRQLNDASFFGSDAFYALFDRMRRDEPVHWTTSPDGRGYWSVFRHADVKHVFNQPLLFSSEREGIMPVIDDAMAAVAREAMGVGLNIAGVETTRDVFYDGIEATGPVERVQSSFLGGLQHLPVKLIARADSRSSRDAR